MKTFDKILVANRGEIAVRVMRTAARMGYRTVAVYSEADMDAPHVREADEAVAIGPAPARASYLDVDRILAAARASGAQAVHPGYGFLSERADFARAVTEAGLVFIGPDADAIEAMGNKSAAKQRMLEAGVPCVPGYQGEDQSDARLLDEARRVGLPVMIKAAAGGGGRGMRLVHEDAQLLDAIRSARSESANAFGSEELLIERAIVDARHVEIQVFGDRHGAIVHLGERDCSVQRRNQKVVEEAPAPGLSDALRLRMGEAAVAAARAVNYVGAGTVEFMLVPDGQFYFLEMNTRLQVEHPVTEMVHGVDLVEWQLRVARGESLPLSQDEILARRRGWAIEVRLCAEDPARDYLPQTGRVLAWRPAALPDLRVDAGLCEGQDIGPYYDSLQAKLIAWGEDREAARLRLVRALEDTRLLGVVSNRDFLHAIVAHEAFASGAVSTSFIGRHFPDAAQRCFGDAARHLALAAVALYLDEARALATRQALAPELVGWHSSHAMAVPLVLRSGEREHRVALRSCGARLFTVELQDEALEIEVLGSTEAGFDYAIDGRRARAVVARDQDEIWLDAECTVQVYRDVTHVPAQAAAAGSDGRLLAPSDGRITAVHVKAGDVVGKNRTLVVLEAMKMEFQLALPVGGTVTSVGVEPGQQVRSRQLLAQIDPEGVAAD